MPGTTTPPKYLTTADVAETIRVGEPVVYDLIKTGGLPARRVGRRWLIDAAELDAWVRSHDPINQTRAETATPELDPVALSPADAEWVAQQVAKFSPEDLRRAAAVFLRIARDVDAADSGAA